LKNVKIEYSIDKKIKRDLIKNIQIYDGLETLF